MQARLFTIFVLIVSLTLVPVPLHRIDARSANHSASVTLNGTGPTLHMNLGYEPPTIDPALAADTSSVQVDELLFLGLTDYDDTTMETVPELATSWNSPDGIVWTFNMRTDAQWSDGTPVRAQDVVYGVTRTLSPTTGSDYAYVLYVIQGAAEYNTQTVTNPVSADTVGVKALDDHTVVFTTTEAAGYFPGIAGMWMARPQPQWAIAAHGSNWTEPANIVTNGPYRLTEWTHDVHMTLQKNATYYDAASVQIGTVDFVMITDANLAYTMYLNCQLDVVNPPSDQLANIRADPILSQQLTTNPILCTYYYGFNTTKAPGNNKHVRRALSYATDRQGLIDNVLQGGQKPAQTFAPPGIFGSPAEDPTFPGIQFNPTLARQELALAGYPDGAGFPATTLMYNTSAGHQAIAQYIRQNWIDYLGISVELANQEWKVYLQTLNTDPPQVFRMGWCADYPDENNWVLDVFHSTRSINYIRWHNPTFDSLVEQAAASTDPTTRQNLYKQAEQILCVDEAGIIPIYYYTRAVLTKPYVQRTFAPLGGEHINKWRITQVQGVIPTGGGQVSSPDTGTALGFPAGAFTATVVMTYTPSTPYPPGTPALTEVANAAGEEYTGIGHCYDVTAVYSGTGQAAQVAPGQTYSVTIQYTEAERGPAIESTLALYHWSGSQWVKEPTSMVDTVANKVTATPNHLSLWTVLGETNRLYLPLIVRSH